MTAYITRRLIQTFIVTILLSVVAFGVMQLMPGDPLDAMISSIPDITAEDIARLKEIYEVDKPFHLRYLDWIGGVVQGDLGYSRTYRVPVQDLVWDRLINTTLLSGFAMVLALIIGIPLGVFSGLKPNSKLDYTANFTAFAGISTPSFFLALVLIMIFAAGLKWFPASGTIDPSYSSMGFWEQIGDRFSHLVLPVISLTALQMGVYVRYARSSMMEAMRNDFIRTARAKGMSRKTVIWIHGFRNALIPIITIVALSLSFLFSGSLITETVFSYQGIGQFLYTAIMNSDYNAAMISFMITIIMVLVMNLLADVLYAVVDPRISYS